MAKVYEQRPYQIKANKNFCEWYPTEERFSSIIIPTGTGKTKIMADTISLLPSNTKALFAAHTEELIDQSFDTIKEANPNKNISIEMAERKGDPKSDIVVASVQTLSRNRNHFKDFIPDIIYIDEAHRFSEYNKQYKGLVDKHPNAKVVLATATPWRASGEELPLGTKLIEMDIGTAVSRNYIVPPKPRIINTNISLASIKTLAGDFNIDQLSKAVNVESRNALIAKNVLQLVQEENRQGILFGVDIEHSKAMAKLLSPYVRVAEVYGETPKEERREIIRKIHAGEIDVICNNLCLLAGFDAAHLSFCVVARPTKSLGVFIQMIGRSLRKFANKTDSIILDIWDKVKASQSRITFFDMASASDLYGDNKRAQEILDAELNTVDLKDGDKIAKKLVHFPVFIKPTDKKDRWTVDSESWFAASWLIADNQWMITWSKDVTLPRQAVETEVFENMFGPPHYSDLINDDFIVNHEQFGKGIAKDIKKDNNIHLLKIYFDKIEESKWMPLDSVKKREIIQTLDETIPAEVIRISRLFYICLPPESNVGRMIHFIKKGTTLIVKHDIKDSKHNIDDFIRGQAQVDDATPLIRSDAAWKKQPASPKQKELIKNYIKWNKVGEDLDIDSISKGDAGSIIDMVMWQDIVIKYFSTNKRENLIGHNFKMDDV